MDIVTQVMQKVNDVFDETHLTQLAYETGFIKRKRKVEAKQFLENMLLLKLESPASSLEDLVYEFSKNNGRIISKQALHKKFNESALAFVKMVLNQLMEHTFRTSNTGLSAIPFVKQVQVIDSSEIRLHPTLKSLFPQVRNQGAAVKLQSLIGAVNHHIVSLEICPSKEPDQGYKKHIGHIQADDLLIGDLGYFCVDTFREVESQGGFFLSRYFKKTSLYDRKTQEPIDLRKHLSLSKGEKITLEVGLGITRLPCRLVALKLPEDAYQKRLKNLAEKRRKDPRTKKNDDDILNRWTILVTNLPLTIDAETLLRLYSLRWQVELFYKMAKTFLQLREIKDTHQQRALFTLHILLIALMLLSFVTITIVDKEISLYKSSKIFVKNIRIFMELVNNKKACAVSWLKELISRFALKESRAARPSTQLSLGWEPLYA
jgi:hypothetical protein